MRNHWGPRPGWRQDRRYYTFHLTLDDVGGADDLRRLISEYHTALAGLDVLDLIPPRWLHMTLQGVGFTDKISEGDIQKVIAAARDRCALLNPFPLAFGAAAVWSEAIVLRAHPPEPARELRHALRTAIAGVLGNDAVPGMPDFRNPHVSLAYSNGDGPAAPSIKAVEGMTVSPASVTVHASSLIVQDMAHHWTRRTQVPFGRA